MPETEHGIIYPESTDHTRLWEHFQNLAETADAALVAAVPDTGWQAWTTGVPTGWTIRVRQIGPTMWVSVNGGTVNVPTGSNVSIATGLPNGVSASWRGCSLAYYPGLITVGTTGILYVRNNSGATRANCQALYSYPTET